MNAAQKQYSHTVLVALLNNNSDLELLKSELWYRIPVETAPPILKNGRLKIIAFYQSGTFKTEKHCIRYMGNVVSTELLERRQLFPDEPEGIKSSKLYYKVVISELRMLKQPIFSIKHRRILFITTTPRKLMAAREAEDLFAGSPQHEKLYNLLQTQNIAAERGYYATHRRKQVRVDLAIICRERNICLEPVPTTGTDPETQERITTLQKMGWSVFTVPAKAPRKHLQESMLKLMQEIENCGGLRDL